MIVARSCRQLSLALCIASLPMIATRARAQTDEIQVYNAEIAAPGVFNLTWHNNFTPDGLRDPAFPGGFSPNRTFNGVTEWAYGVAPWFEAGLYLPLYSITGDGGFMFNGFKLRTLFVVPNAAERSFFYGINFEFSWNAGHWDPHRYSLRDPSDHRLAVGPRRPDRESDSRQFVDELLASRFRPRIALGVQLLEDVGLGRRGVR